MNKTIITLFVLTVLLVSGCSTDVERSFTEENYGVTNEGRTVEIYTLSNAHNARVRITNYGAIVQSLYVPDRNDQLEDIVLGYDTLEEYLKDTSFFGAIVGRFGNRIAGGKFSLNGEDYQLSQNEGNNHLHGGTNGFFRKVWEAEKVHSDLGPALQLTYLSPDMEEGYPGNLTITVIYTLTDNNELRIDYTATTDKRTIINPTHHSYFNLSGDFNIPILDHELTIDADTYTPIDADFIPTGELKPVADTPMDFRNAIQIGTRINDEYDQLKFAGGYDHNWVLNNFDGTVRKVAELFDPGSGRTMEVYTDQPGLQFYSGNFLDGTIIGKGGILYRHRTGLCLETQFFPNSPNEESFPSVVLNPGETYRQTTIYRFTVR
jgi:aldose 1-epimerase